MASGLRVNEMASGLRVNEDELLTETFDVRFAAEADIILAPRDVG